MSRNGLLHTPQTDADTGRQRRLLDVLLRWFVGIAAVTMTLLGATLLLGLWHAQGSDMTRMLIAASLLVVGATACHVLNQRGRYKPASIVLVGVLIISIALSDDPLQVVQGRTFFVFIIPVMIASILLRPIDGLIVAGVVSALVTLMGALLVRALPSIPSLGGLGAIAAATWASSNSLSQALSQLQREAAQRERLQQSLQQSEERFRLISELTSDYAYSFGVAEDGSLRIEWVSDAFTRITGYTIDEARAWDRLSRMMHPDDLAISELRAKRLLAGETDVSEFRIVTKSGAIRSVRSYMRPVRDEALGRITRIYGATQDISDYKRAEETLRQSEERYRIASELASDYAYCVRVEPDGRRVTEWATQAMTHITGFTGEELEQRGGWNSIVHPDDTPILQQRLQDLDAGRTNTCEYRITAKDGETRWLRNYGRGIWDEKEGRVTLIYGATQDITEHKAAAAALSDQERSLQSVFRAAPVGIGVVANRVFMMVNDRVCEMLDYAREELLGQSSRMVYPNEDEFLRVGRDKYADIAVAGVGMIETRWQTKDRRILDILLRSCPIDPNDLSRGVTFAALDITDRRLAEQALRESERRFREILENVQLVALLLDTEGRVTFCNQFTLDLLGLPREEVIGQFWFDRFVPGEDGIRIKSIYFDHINQGEMPAHYENPIRTPRGETRLILWDNTVMRDPRGQVTGLASLGRDVTEQRQLETRFLQAQKMEAVGRLAGGIAHDFNNLLTVINGYSEMLLSSLSAGELFHNELREIHQAGVRAAELTAQLLAFSRKQIMEPRVIDLNNVLTSTAPMLTRLIGEDIHLVIKPGPGLGKVKADPGQMQQVLLNLSVNARDAMPQGGSLTIETVNVTLDSGYMLRDPDISPGPFVMLAVSDTGVGMNEAVKQHLFEPFFTTKEVGKGTGLGLSTIYGIVKQSGGTVSVYSEPGQGATFKVYLPRVNEPFVEAPARTTGFPRGAETILVVEDNADVRRFTERLLHMLGYHVLTAQSGPDALALVATRREQVPLVVTDVVMPEMGGRVFAERLAAIHPETRVLFMSGYTDNAIIQHGVLETDAHYIQKPFTLEALAQKVRAILDMSETEHGGKAP